MHLLYVDESGDPGVFTGRNSRHYILSGIIVPDYDWNKTFFKIQNFRRNIYTKYGFPYREEIHASELIRVNKLKSYRNIRKTDRIKILKEMMLATPQIFSSSKIINICFDKQVLTQYNEFSSIAWSRLIQRFDTYLKKEAKDVGIIIPDMGNEKSIRGLMRKMRVFNPVPSHFGGTRQLLTDNIIEDPFMRDSKHSPFIQTADAVAHCLYRKEYPKGSLKKYRLENYFNYLNSILLVQASTYDPLGIVRK